MNLRLFERGKLAAYGVEINSTTRMESRMERLHWMTDNSVIAGDDNHVIVFIPIEDIKDDQDLADRAHAAHKDGFDYRKRGHTYGDPPRIRHIFEKGRKR